jgi:hypothetical protein
LSPDPLITCAVVAAAATLEVLMPPFQNDPVVSRTDSTSAAVFAENSNPTPQAGVGVHARSAAAAVLGESSTWHGVAGITQSTTGGAGVFGAGDTGGPGVIGVSKTWIGVYGETNAPAASGACGVLGEGKNGGDGVKGHASAPNKAAIAGFHLTNTGLGVFGRGATGGRFEGTVAGVSAKGGGDQRNLAGFFDGNVEVLQTVKAFDVFILGSDCAEDFDATASAQTEPGTVMVIGEDARLTESQRAYDKRVAGIVSGAGHYRPGIVLGKEASRPDRVPLALVGKVFCKADATYGPIEVGDLLTTSDTEGHAMKADDPGRAFGAVLGKAMGSLREGRGLVPILVTLQ